jgi:hypothetical protein
MHCPTFPWLVRVCFSASGVRPSPALQLLAAALAAVTATCACLQVWRHHWDFQLYKALEVQFRAGLENINRNLPEVRQL